MSVLERCRTFVAGTWELFVYFASGEWILTKSGSNGGDVILFRSLLVAIELAAIALALRNWVDPALNGPPAWTVFRTQVIDIAPWFVAAAGAVYAALYARFSAQWSYLASLYNQIKQAELEMAYTAAKDPEGLKRLAEWKAGYIEDAHALHLHAKKNVAAIVHHWGKDSTVASAFVGATAGGHKRWDRIQFDAAKAYASAAKEYA